MLLVIVSSPNEELLREVFTQPQTSLAKSQMKVAGIRVRLRGGQSWQVVFLMIV